MLVRITGGSEGIAEYLANGQKAGREFTRDELDERVILDGDLELTDTIIKGMEKEGERYLHITLAFKEDEIGWDKLHAITDDFKKFAMTAYEGDEYNFYAEAHLPKLKSYTNQKTGELIERKPHIHIVIPEYNLLSGKNLNPFGKVDQQTKFLEAFQEHINAKFGLASPKDNRRIEFTDESAIISRYKGDYFEGASHDLKARILSGVLDKGVTDYDQFRAIVAKHGDTKTRNAGKAGEYLNVMPEGANKGVNLKEYVFSREFIEMPAAEKRQKLAVEIRAKYEEAKAPRPSPSDIAERLQEWREVRAAELKYMNSGNRKLYASYRSADRDAKRAMLDERAATFYTKHRKETDHDRTDEQRRDFRGRENAADRGTDSRRIVAHIANNLRAAGRNIRSTGRAVGGTEQARRNLADRRVSRVVAALGRRLGYDQSADQQVSRAAPQPRDRRAADSVTGQLLAEARERKTDAKAAHLSEFAQIKRELDASRLLAHLSKTHGVIPEKYEITKDKGGGDRIKAGPRNLNVSDFLTQEVRLSFTEAAPILRQVYAAQQGRELAEARPEPPRELWHAFREAQPAQAKQKATEWDAQRQSERERRATIRDDYQAERRALRADRSKNGAERKATLSIVRMERVTKDMALREAVKEERQHLQGKYGMRTYQARYRAFLADRANQGDEAALAELRRQSDASPTPAPAPATEANTIEGSTSRKRESDQAAQLARNLAYSIDRAGNVTYYADQAKRRALVIDSGQRVTVATVKDSQAVEAGLRLAVQKFGPGLKIEGSEEFKRQVIDAALKTGLRVEFDSKAMNDELQRRRVERDELQARGKAFIASASEKAEQEKAPKQRATQAPAPELNREPERAPQPEPARKPRGYER